MVAETLSQARDAAELIEVDYEELPCVVDIADAFRDGAAQVHADAPCNVCYDWELGDRAQVDAASTRARDVILARARRILWQQGAISPASGTGSASG